MSTTSAGAESLLHLPVSSVLGPGVPQSTSLAGEPETGESSSLAPRLGRSSALAASWARRRTCWCGRTAPRRIDRRVLKRPGRIDRVIAVGALRSRAVAAVASGLLPEDVSLPPAELGKALDRTTPEE